MGYTAPKLESDPWLWHRSSMPRFQHLIDSHCHLSDARIVPDIDAVLRRSREAGVNGWIVPSASVGEWERLAGLARRTDGLHAAFGIHPWYCDRHSQNDFAQLRTYLSKAVALGECGLDLGPGRPDEGTQLDWLRRQLELAAELELPVILHAHKALDRLTRELRSFHGLRGVLHGFAGSRQQADQLLDLGYDLGIGMRLLRPEAGRFRELVRELPIGRICIETDAPDQALPGMAGACNEPAALPRVLAELAAIRKIPDEQLAAQCNANARELFHL